MHGSFVSRTHQNIRRDDPRRESLRTKRQNIRRIAKMYVPSQWVYGLGAATMLGALMWPALAL